MTSAHCCYADKWTKTGNLIRKPRGGCVMTHSCNDQMQIQTVVCLFPPLNKKKLCIYLFVKHNILHDSLAIYTNFLFLYMHVGWRNMSQWCQQTRQSASQRPNSTWFTVELVCFGFSCRQFSNSRPWQRAKNQKWDMATGGDLWKKTSGEKRVSQVYWLFRDTSLKLTFLKTNIKTKSYITLTRLRTHDLVHISETFTGMNTNN